MAVSTAVLRELHRIHGQLSDLRDRLARGPRQVQVHQKNVAEQQSILAAASAEVKQTKLAIDRKNLDLQSSESKIGDLQAKLNGCSSNKEYQTLLDQIAATEMANSVLADEILEIMEKCDQFEAIVTKSEGQVKAAEAEFLKCQERVASEATVMNADVERLEGDLVKSEKNLPAEIKPDYDRIIRSKGSDGMAESESQTCLGCGKQITLNMQNDLLMSRPVFCKSCGCLLYLVDG